MQTSILILGWNDAHHLPYCLPAAKRQQGSRVFVVDNASDDGTADLLREHAVDHLRLDERRSYCEAVNIGLAATADEAVLLLNADCFLEPDFLAAALPRLEEQGVGSVTGKLLRTEGPQPWQRLDRIDTMGIEMHRSRKNFLAGFDESASARDRSMEVFGPDGAAALYRRETLEQCMIDGEVLDEDFDAWASDVDLAWRARVMGWRSVYEPAAIGYHVRTYRPDTRDRMPRRARRLVFRNRYLMIVKNDTLGGLARDLHHLMLYEVMVLAYALLREPHLLLGYLGAARLLPRAWRKRRVLRRRCGERGLTAGAAENPHRLRTDGDMNAIGTQATEPMTGVRTVGARAAGYVRNRRSLRFMSNRF